MSVSDAPARPAWISHADKSAKKASFTPRLYSHNAPLGMPPSSEQPMEGMGKPQFRADCEKHRLECNNPLKTRRWPALGNTPDEGNTGGALALERGERARVCCSKVTGTTSGPAGVFAEKHSNG